MLRITGKITNLVLIGIVLSMMLICGLPVKADEVSTDAEVNVVDGDTLYGYKNVDSEDVIQEHHALKAPDTHGAGIFFHGWIIIEFKSTIAKSSMISYWASNEGWQKSNIKVYISKDGKKWTYIDQRMIENHHIQKYDIYGNFKNVRYIKITRNAGLFSWLQLDAVGAKRG